MAIEQVGKIYRTAPPGSPAMRDVGRQIQETEIAHRRIVPGRCSPGPTVPGWRLGKRVLRPAADRPATDRAALGFAPMQTRYLLVASVITGLTILVAAAIWMATRL